MSQPKREQLTQLVTPVVDGGSLFIPSIDDEQQIAVYDNVHWYTSSSALVPASPSSETHVDPLAWHKRPGTLYLSTHRLIWSPSINNVGETDAKGASSADLPPKPSSGGSLANAVKSAVLNYNSTTMATATPPATVGIAIGLDAIASHGTTSDNTIAPGRLVLLRLLDPTGADDQGSDVDDDDDDCDEDGEDNSHAQTAQVGGTTVSPSSSLTSPPKGLSSDDTVRLAGQALSFPTFVPSFSPRSLYFSLADEDGKQFLSILAEALVSYDKRTQLEILQQSLAAMTVTSSDGKAEEDEGHDNATGDDEDEEDEDDAGMYQVVEDGKLNDLISGITRSRETQNASTALRAQNGSSGSSAVTPSTTERLRSLGIELADMDHLSEEQERILRTLEAKFVEPKAK